MIVTSQELYLMEERAGFKLQSTFVSPNKFSLAGQCPFLKDKSCTIYDVRPCQCRLYHCGRLKLTDKKLDTLREIRLLMESNSEYSGSKRKWTKKQSRGETLMVGTGGR